MLIDGRLLAQKILEELKLRVEKLQSEKNIIPHLAIIRIGNDPATTSYVNQKEKMGKQIGGMVSTYNFPENASEYELLQSISFLQTKGDIHGIIVQLPLPQQLNEEKLIFAIDADKDVDGFRTDSLFPTPIAAAVMRILEEVYQIERGKEGKFFNWLQSQKIVILGKGKTGGRPIINTLKKIHIEPTIIDSKTHRPELITKTADILICAVGNKGTIVTADMIKKDSILIGIGMSLDSDGKLRGDYETEEIKDIAGYYTPIPGGVGPVNAAMLLVNVVEAAEKTV